jgi:preprotein translocase subunit SecA
MTRIGMEDGVPIEHRWISKAIENAQKKVEAHNFDIRKHLLEYDDVMNKQREVVYHRRRELLSGAPLKEDVIDMCGELIDAIVAAHADKERDPSEWEWKEIEDGFFKQFKFRPAFRENLNGMALDAPDDLIELATERIQALYQQRETEFTEPVMRQIEKIVMLQTLDALWKDHLLAMDHLKEGIGLRGYGQRNPLVEYQREGFEMFEAMMQVMQQDVVEKVFAVEVRKEQDVEQIEQQQQRPQKVVMSHGGETVDQTAPTVKREGDKVGRNDPCPCGSGKKYKRCHGK